jgi:hypothetical protein
VRQYRIATAPRTRLACVKHAASVRSEPGSNSRLKPVAWVKIKMLSKLQRASLPKQIVDSLDLLKAVRARRTVYERILAHRIGCQRAVSLLSSRKAYKQPNEYTNRVQDCQHSITAFPQAGIGAFGLVTKD